jgi:SAM-dependent methyltransferase
LGARVVAIDLLPQSIAIKHPDIEVRQADIMSLEGSQAFDLIINCSTLEHVGVSGRFDSVEDADRDVAAMQRMRGLLKPGGIMLLTLPVGQDAVFAPQHRVYGAQRLPRVLAGYDVVEAMFWCKGDDNCWALCDRERAMAELGSAQYYALGCMTLRSSSDDRV